MDVVCIKSLRLILTSIISIPLNRLMVNLTGPSMNQINKPACTLESPTSTHIPTKRVCSKLWWMIKTCVQLYTVERARTSSRSKPGCYVDYDELEHMFTCSHCISRLAQLFGKD